jgi:hypothetical protein
MVKLASPRGKGMSSTLPYPVKKKLYSQQRHAVGKIPSFLEEMVLTPSVRAHHARAVLHEGRAREALGECNASANILSVLHVSLLKREMPYKSGRGRST